MVVNSKVSEVSEVTDQGGVGGGGMMVIDQVGMCL